jgi:hypothetical protein
VSREKTEPVPEKATTSAPTPTTPPDDKTKPSSPSRRRREIQRPQPPVLRFTPTAWAKLQFFCHAGETEIGGFGITPSWDLLLVEEFVTIRQQTSVVTVAFDDDAVADFFDDQVMEGRRPEQFARIWLHTHPGDSATPSCTDEETFARVFGPSDWAVMFILAKGGQTYARLHFNTGPGGHLLIPVMVDYSQPFEGSDHPGWEDEYDAHIQPLMATKGSPRADMGLDFGDRWLEEMERHEQQRSMELAEEMEAFGTWPRDEEVWR